MKKTRTDVTPSTALLPSSARLPSPLKLKPSFSSISFPILSVSLILMFLIGCSSGPNRRAVLQDPFPIPTEEFESLLARGKTYQARALLEPLASPEQANSIRGLARLGLGRCDLVDLKIEDSVRHLNKARKLLPPGPDQARAQFYLGVAYLRNKSVMSALNYLEAAFSGVRDPDLKTRAAYLISRTLDELGDPVSTLYRNTAGDKYFPEYSGIWARPTSAIVKSTVEISPKISTPKKEVRKLTPPPRLKLIKRNQWSAGPVRKASVNPMTRPFRITVHHTADQENLSAIGKSDPQEYLQILQRYCQNTLDWGDIGYHYLISKDGRIWEGRSMRYQGAHAGNSTLNRGNIGIALIGNFDHEKPSTAQIRSLQNLLSGLCDNYSISPGKIFGHGDLKTTGCPGRHLSEILRELIRKLKSNPLTSLSTIQPLAIR